MQETGRLSSVLNMCTKKQSRKGAEEITEEEETERTWKMEGFTPAGGNLGPSLLS